jgi:hypothetical protein
MKTVSSTLATAQSAASRTPYIHLLFTSPDGLTTYDYSSDQQSRRILMIDHREDSTFDRADIVLRNNDRTVPELQGYWTEIGYGDVTGSGNEYSATPRLWVKQQQTVSAGGKLFSWLVLEGMWAHMREDKIMLGSPPYYSETRTGQTVYAVIQEVLSEAGYTLKPLAESDGIIDVFTPELYINNQPFESFAEVVDTLIRMTKCYLRPKPNNEFEVVYPQSTDTEDLVVYSSQSPYFLSYEESRNLLIPNHIYVVANQSEDGSWDSYVIGEASDADEIAKYKDIRDIAVAATITNETDADTRATVILARAKAETLAAKILMPHDCRIELFDNVVAQDTR